MPVRDTLPVNVVGSIKQALADGIPQQDIAEQYGIAQSTISNIKTGRKYEAVPWPDGTLGGKSSVDLKANKSVAVSDDASSYDGWPLAQQALILKAVNKRRASTGAPPIPNVSLEWQVYMDSPAGDDPTYDIQRRAVAGAAENRRKSAIMKEFTSIVACNMQQHMSSDIDEIVSACAKAPLPPTVHRTEVLLDPTVYTVMDIDDLLHRGALHELLNEGLINKDSATIEACAIVFMLLPEKHWSADYCIKAINEVRLEVLRSPCALAAAEARYVQILNVTDDNPIPTSTNNN